MYQWYRSGSHLMSAILKILIILLFSLSMHSAFSMEVAITIDDIPVSGDLPPNITRIDVVNKMLAVLKKHHITGVYGLMNGKSAVQDKDGFVILKEWLTAGHFLGNHTYSHLDLAKVNSSDYIADIQKNEKILNQLMQHKDYHYFRYPYLSEGNTQEKRNTVRQFLFNNGYKIAPVTVDFFEYEWINPYVRCTKKNDIKSIEWLRKSYIEQANDALIISRELSLMLFNRDIKHVLLIHINAFTTDMLDELLTSYEKQGVKFISLKNALEDDVYKINRDIVRDRAYTFLNQVRLSRKLKNPVIVQKLYETLPEKKLERICQ